MKIGVFDSGIGGEAVAQALRREFPKSDVLVENDRAHVPYGNRTAKEIIELTDNAIQPLLNNRCDVIVLACNTATAAAIEVLREKYENQKFIGLDPMVKPAAIRTKTGVIAVCATPFTLHSERYIGLKNKFAGEVKVIEPDCSNWASMIENNELNSAQIIDTVDEVCKKGADIIVLACTHYHWIRREIEYAAKNRAIVIDPSHAIAERIRFLLGAF